MIFNEPERTRFDVNFRLFGIHVRIHPFFWVFCLFLSPVEKPREALIWVGVTVLSLLIHEFGHVLAFKRLGIPSDIVLQAFGGLAVPRGWGYSGGFPRLSHGNSAFVAFAGPGLQALVAVAVMALVKASGNIAVFERGGMIGFFSVVAVPGFPFLTLFLTLFVYFSLFWAVVNLLPIIPLDGGRISSALFQRIDRDTGLKQALILSIITAGAVALYVFTNTRSIFNTLLFAYLAAMSFKALQELNYGDRRW